MCKKFTGSKLKITPFIAIYIGYIYYREILGIKDSHISLMF